MAQIAGSQEYHGGGQMWYPEYLIQTSLSGLRRATWDDNQRARLRRHILVMAGPSCWKSTTSRTWLSEYVGAVDIGEVTTENEAAVSLPWTSGVSWEKARGSAAQNGRPLTPLLPLANFFIASEFQSFLGRVPQKRAMMTENLNETLEEGRISVGLVKMGSRNPRHLEQDRERLATYGVTYNPDTNFISYPVRGAAICCTRPFAPEVHTELELSGLLSRFRLMWWRPSAEAYKAAWEKGPGDPSEHRPALQRLCRMIWESEFRVVNYPPRGLMLVVKNALSRIYAEMEGKLGIPVEKMRSMRDEVDAAQLITVHAVLRTLSPAWRDPNSPTALTFDRLSYLEEDATWAARYIERAKGGEFDDWAQNARFDAGLEDLYKTLTEFVKTHDALDAFARKDIVQWLKTEKSLPSTTAYRRVAVLVREGLLVALNAQTLTLGDRARRDLGFPVDVEIPVDMEV